MSSKFNFSDNLTEIEIFVTENSMLILINHLF